MVRMPPLKLYIANLRGQFPPERLGYLGKEEAQRGLVSITGQDFGFDVEKWQEWIKANPQKVTQAAKSPRDAIGILRAQNCKNLQESKTRPDSNAVVKRELNSTEEDRL